MAIRCVTARCKTCGMKFENKERLEKHRKVHGRKPKVTYAGSLDIHQVGV